MRNSIIRYQGTLTAEGITLKVGDEQRDPKHCIGTVQESINDHPFPEGGYTLTIEKLIYKRQD